MNNKGFAITGILYTILIMFLVFISMMLFNLQNRKTILDELKTDTVEAVESDNNYEYLLNEINSLKKQIGSKDVSSIGDGTITGAINGVYQNSIYDFSNYINTTNASITNGWSSEFVLKNGRVSFNIIFSMKVEVGPAWVNIGTLPVELRPRKNYLFSCVSNNVSVMLRITTEGYIYVISTGTIVSTGGYSFSSGVYDV